MESVQRLQTRRSTVRPKTYREMLKYNQRYLTKKSLIYLVCISAIVAMLHVTGFAATSANASQAYTSIMSGSGFEGSMAIIDKFNWLGYIVSFLISMFCLIGLILNFMSVLITVLYKSSQGLWDEVADIKSNAKGTSFFGLVGMGQNTWKANGSMGGGLDSIIGFFLGLLPNVKELSYYSTVHKSDRFDEGDSIWDFVLKVLPQTVFITFLFIIGFNGGLAKLYTILSDVLLQFYNRAISTSLVKDASQIANIGNGFSFTIGANGSEEGEQLQSICESIYDKVDNYADITSSSGKQAVGEAIQNWVQSTVLPSIGDKSGISGWTGSDSDWEGLNYSVSISPTSTQYSDGYVEDIHAFDNSYPAGKEYVQLYFQKSSSADTQYFGNQAATA